MKRRVSHYPMIPSPFSSASLSTDETTKAGKERNRNSLLTSRKQEWIPPDRPLSGDQGNSKLYKKHENFRDTEQAMEHALFVIDDDDSEAEILRKLEEALLLEEELEKKKLEYELELETETTSSDRVVPGPTDWLATRRAALAESSENDTSKNPVPIIEGELLSDLEMKALLKSLGGDDIILLLDDPDQPRMGGATGFILCTASSPFHIRSLTMRLVDHLKQRKLDALGVPGAQIGSRSYKQPTSTWNVVDCQNYIVHIFDVATRRALALEELWSGEDQLWTLDVQDDDEVERYVAENPVPFTYGSNPESLFDVGKLERNQFIPHRPVVSGMQKQIDRKVGRKKQRELQQR